MPAVTVRWPRWLPAVLSVVAGSALAAYVLFTPVTSLPDGTSATGLQAGNPFLIGLALVVPGLAVAGAAGAVRRQRRLLWGTGLSLLGLGSLPVALGLQVWIVGLLVLLSALLSRDGGRDATRLVVPALVLAALAGLLALTILTTPVHSFATAALGVSLFVGALLSALGALVGGAAGRLGPAFVGFLVVSSGLAGAVVITEAPVAAAPPPRLLAFDTTGPACATDGGRTSSAGSRPAWNRVVITISGAVSVPDTTYELDRPALVETAPGRYTLTIERRETDAADRGCPARIEYSATVRLPRHRSGAYHLEVRYDGDVVQEVWSRDGSSGLSG